MSKQKILPVEPLIQCEAGRAKTMQRQSLYSPRTPKWPQSDKGEMHQKTAKGFSETLVMSNDSTEVMILNPFVTHIDVSCAESYSAEL